MGRLSLGTPLLPHPEVHNRAPAPHAILRTPAHRYSWYTQSTGKCAAPTDVQCGTHGWAFLFPFAPDVCCKLPTPPVVPHTCAPDCGCAPVLCPIDAHATRCKGCCARPSPQTCYTPVPSSCPHQSDPTLCPSLVGGSHLISCVGCHTRSHGAAVLPSPLWVVSHSYIYISTLIYIYPGLPKQSLGARVVTRGIRYEDPCRHAHAKVDLPQLWPPPATQTRESRATRPIPLLAGGGPGSPALRTCSVEASCRDSRESSALQQLIPQVPGCDRTLQRQLHTYAQAPVILG